MKIKLLLSIATTTLIVACNQPVKQDTKSINNVDSVITSNNKENTVKFDINQLKISDADMGDFPYFTAPKGATYINNVKPKAFDFIVFASPDDIIEKEGQVYRAFIHPDKNNSQIEISNRYLLKSYEDAILNLGGVKVYEGKLTGEALEKYNKLATYAGDDGSIDVNNNEVVSYVIRRSDGNVYIMLDKNTGETSAIQIVKEKPLVQTIKKISSDEISKDLNEKGKSILYINFDVDKSQLTNDGIDVVNEISKALRTNPNIKISIEGHTDNTGDANHNKKLSESRANAVLQKLKTDGIDPIRMSAVGYGAEKPLVANDSEDNKAKNRRVELIKVK